MYAALRPHSRAVGFDPRRVSPGRSHRRPTPPGRSGCPQGDLLDLAHREPLAGFAPRVRPLADRLPVFRRLGPYGVDTWTRSNFDPVSKSRQSTNTLAGENVP